MLGFIKVRSRSAGVVALGIIDSVVVRVRRLFIDTIVLKVKTFVSVVALEVKTFIGEVVLELISGGGFIFIFFVSIN